APFTSAGGSRYSIWSFARVHSIRVWMSWRKRMPILETTQRPSLLPRFLQPDAPVAPIVAEPAEIRRLCSHYRFRVLFWTTIGYAIFYFVRKNLSTAMPVMEEKLH